MPSPVGLDRATRRSSASGLQARIAVWPSPGSLALGQLQAVGLVVAPAAQVHRLALAVLDLHPEQLDEEAQALLRERRQQLGVADVGEVVDRLRAHRLDLHPRAGRRGRRRARRPGACARLTRSRSLALARGLEHLVDALVLDDRDAVGVEHEHVALADRRAADRHRLADRARDVLGRALHADPARPDRQAQLGQLLDVADRGVDQDRRGARGPWPGWPAGRRPAPPAAARASSARAPRRAATAPSRRAPSGCRPGRSARSAPGPAAREPGTIWIRSAST